MCSVQENIAKKAVLVTATSTSASVSASMAYMKEGGTLFPCKLAQTVFDHESRHSFKTFRFY